MVANVKEKGRKGKERRKESKREKGKEKKREIGK
jgi:hypothetical protein